MVKKVTHIAMHIAIAIHNKSIKSTDTRKGSVGRVIIISSTTQSAV